LQYQDFRVINRVREHSFHLVSGNLELSGDKERAFYDYLLVEDDNGNRIPIEALFDDINVSGLVFPLNKFTQNRWLQQHPDVQNGLLLADLRDIVIEHNKFKVTLWTWGRPKFVFERGKKYRISARLVDFNINKVLATLFELDLRSDGECDPSFVQLITDLRSFALRQPAIDSKLYLQKETKIQKLFRDFEGLDRGGIASALILKQSQQRATRRLLSNRLAVIWGPPGMHTDSA